MDWEKFKSPWLKIEKGTQVDVILANPTPNTSDFGDKTKELKLVCDFDVQYLNGQALPKGTIFRTASKALVYNEFKPLFERSMTGQIHVIIKRDLNGRYAVVQV